MSTLELNNLWMYIQGMSLAQDEREWLAGKLLEPPLEDPETIRQQAFVKESLYRALDEVKRAQRGEATMMTEEQFLQELKEDGLL